MERGGRVKCMLGGRIIIEGLWQERQLWEIEKVKSMWEL